MAKRKKETLNLTFHLYDGINQTPAIPLIAAMWIEMLEKGWMRPETVGSWDNQVIVAMHGEEVVGMLAFEHIKWRKMIWISMAYIVPFYRVQGAYTQLFNFLKQHCKTMQPRPVEIQGGISVHNKPMLFVAESQGRSALFTVYSYDLKDDSDEKEDKRIKD